MAKNYYMNKANFLLEKLEEETESNQVIELDQWSWDFNKGPYTLYTATDGNGNYALANDGSVFFTEYEDGANQLEIDGKPHSKGNQLFVYEKDGKIGIYDDNFVLKFDPFKNQDEASEFINGQIKNKKIQIKNDEMFLV